MIHFLLCLFVLFMGCGQKEKKVIETRVQERPQVPFPVPAPSEINFVSFDRQESDTLQVLEQLAVFDQIQTRFITLCEQFNEGKRDLEKYVKASNKTINSVSLERDIFTTRGAGDTGCVRSIRLGDIGWDRADWQLVENAFFNLFRDSFESFTTRGRLIKNLTRSRFPSIPGHIFSFIVLNQPVYSRLLRLPENQKTLLLQLGINLQRNFDTEDRDTFLACVTQSPISITKPRCMLRTESRDGFYYTTFDVLERNAGNRNANPFENPFPIEARSRRTFKHDGSESIFSLPNGFNGYYLADAAGVRIDAAPTDLVVDPGAASRSLTPVINYLSCHDCHANGIIEVEDELFNKVKNDPSFNFADRQKAQFWYGRSSGFTAIQRRDNGRFEGAKALIGISNNENDQINGYTDRIRQESSLEQVAALLSLRPQEFADKLQSSRLSLEQGGQLLSGDTITLEQLRTFLPVFVREANVFRNNFGE